ncbi:MAG: DUF839 domain-containing protein, partial [Hyphomonadaceae bacterium]
MVSRMGDVMSDGLLEPGAHDGMSCFPVEGDADRCILVRNHELTLNETGERGAFGPGYERLGKVDRGVVYDWASASHPYLGGTTTLLVNLKSNQVERSHMSLIGTCHNCAGGPTPWGSWLSCEESSVKAGDHAGKDHGFVFEVPAAATRAVTPTPLRAMGRFVHEAVAIDPTTGIAYMTEDQGDGLIYRFLPDSSGELAGGGRLQALAITAQTGADLRNWTDETDRVVSVNQGQSFDARWIDLDRVDAPDNDLRLRGRDSGAAIFARGEGMAFALENNRPVIYFASTSGGKAQKGQIWRYYPSEVEGQSDETSRPGKLELFVESLGAGHFDYADNIVAAPIGDIVMCEDGDGDNFVR